MKIGIDIRTLMDARYSGVSEYTFNLVKEILKLDSQNDYRLFYNCFGDCPNISTFAEATADKPEFADKKVKIIKYNYPNKVLNYLLFKFLNYPKIDKELGVDVFFMPHLNFAGMSSGARSLITVHDLSFLRYPEFFSARKNIWHRLLNVKKLLNRFSQVIAISENTQRDIVELCGINPDKVKVIYSGVDESCRIIRKPGFAKALAGEPAPGIRNINAPDDASLSLVKQKYNLPEKFILYLGTVEPRKNVDGVIAAYNALRITPYAVRDYKLVIAGSKGWKSKSVYQAWEQSEFKDDIKFLDYVNSEDKVYLYNLASVFIYPSFYEGFGFPPLEAMACGLPVAASFASSLSEVVGDAALMVDPYNINDIACALAEILTDENLRNKLIARGLEQAKKFSWEKAAREYLEVFKKL